MTSTITDALQALPEDLREPAPMAPTAAEIAEAARARRVPTSALHRSYLITSTSARIALGYAALGLRHALSKSEVRAAARTEADHHTAVRLLARMSYLRGAAMKVGQIMSQMPELTSEHLAETLGALCFDAPPMHYALIHEQMRAEFDAEPDAKFASFEREAFAAASLGQVHRATTHDGRDVAVKVQYPGIARAIRADLATFRTLLYSMRLSSQYHNLRDQLDVIVDMLTGETDYRREAELQRHAARTLRPEDGLIVPDVIDTCSSGRVLTSTYLDGMPIGQYLTTQPDRAERTEIATRIWGGLVRLFYGGRFTYNDPNPGNFIILPGGRVGLVDFGCTTVYDDEAWAVIKEVDTACQRHPEDLAELTAHHLGMTLGRERDARNIDLVVDMMMWLNEPMRVDRFNFGADDYMGRGVDIMKEICRRRFFRNCPFSLWSNRLLIGIRALLARLDVEIPARAIYEREFRGAFGA